MDISSGGLFQRIGLVTPRRQCAAAFMDGALFDDEAALFERCAQASIRLGLLRVDPDHQHPVRPEEVREPIDRRLQGSDRAPPPIDKRNIVLPGRPQFPVAAARV
jgi:hypothetical protein